MAFQIHSDNLGRSHRERRCGTRAHNHPPHVFMTAICLVESWFIRAWVHGFLHLSNKYFLSMYVGTACREGLLEAWTGYGLSAGPLPREPWWAFRALVDERP